ncbi:MAG: hypothetical protein ACRCUE_01145 [Bosea sp. (in: a-proteobacteria)]
MTHFLSTASLVALLATGSGLFAPASAQDVVNIANAKGAEESVYFAAVRDWKVIVGSVDGRPAYCAMTKGESSGELRFGYDGGQWQMAVPYSAKRGEYAGRMTLDGYASGTYGESDGRWTFLWLNLGERDALMNGKRVVIEVGKASIDHDLSGTSAAIRKVEECAGRRLVAASTPAGGGQPEAKPQVATPVANAAPGAASVTAAGTLHEKPLGKIGAWEISRVTRDPAGRQFAYCDAFVMTGSEQGLRLTLHGKGSSFGFSGQGSGAIGQTAALDVWFNNDRASATSLEGKLTANAGGFEWMMIEEGNDQPGFIDDALPNSRTVSFRYRLDGKAHVETFALRDAKKVIDRLIACRDGG